jgi:hypothetical protein
LRITEIGHREDRTSLRSPITETAHHQDHHLRLHHPKDHTSRRLHIRKIDIAKIAIPRIIIPKIIIPDRTIRAVIPSLSLNLGLVPLIGNYPATL